MRSDLTEEQQLIRRRLPQKILQVGKIDRSVKTLRDTARAPAHVAQHGLVVEHLSTQTQC